MKLQVVFFKKKFIYYALVIIAFAIALNSFLFFTNNSINTFNIIDETKMLQSDLTGDGTKDILYIKTDTDKYYIQINSGDKSYYLDPSKKIKTVGNYYTQWPMRLTLMDISRNKVPEIFTQASIEESSRNNKPIQHVFFWNGEKFDDIFCSNNNILGFVDSKNNKTPKVLSGNIKEGKINFMSYILIKNSLKPFDYNYIYNYMGKDTVLGFINLMTSFPMEKLNISKNIFAPGLSGNDISLLNDLSSRKVYFNFQDAVFKDSNWDKNGNANEILWTLNFRGNNTVGVTETKNYTLELILNLIPNSIDVSTFKITSINIK
ncbi:VCBS repeat-containing protein [Clostridium sp.]|uniref:VCBS repeat-containing protein n=1 Tax=Clostridium sp. TaxID=1506 RepID=UPI001A59E5D8|nr:VCBS repeat-containing protein [Clostridium sp.]MBK5243036.1 VCBS repeat-containing protein [Clostridium sp.]